MNQSGQRDVSPARFFVGIASYLAYASYSLRVCL